MFKPTQIRSLPLWVATLLAKFMAFISYPKSMKASNYPVSFVPQLKCTQ